MRSINILVTVAVIFSITACGVHIKNATTESVRIDGNCAMCKSYIENAGNVNRVSRVNWNNDTKMATLTYDSTLTNQEEILKRIALAGYDSKQYLAPDNVYANLPDCCKYDRVNKSLTIKTDNSKDHSMHRSDTISGNQTEVKNDTQHNTQHNTQHDAKHDNKQDTRHDSKNETNNASMQDNQLNKVYENYFEIKDALVKSDVALTSKSASQLVTSIKAVQMNKMSSKEHSAWMKGMDELEKHAVQIRDSKDIAKQRDHFMALTENTYQLMKSSGHDAPVYYQHCPMANEGKGANWLSKENAIRNPYYGASMLTCGKTVETIQ